MTRFNALRLGGAVILLAAAGLLLSRQSASPTRDGPLSELAQKSDRPQEPEKPGSPRRQNGSRWKGLPELPPPVISPHPSGSEENQNWITGRIAELDDDAWLDDPEAMRRILAELYHPQAEIRKAARAAITAFGSRDAVPYLEMVSSTTYDEAERQQLTEVINFLKLPTLLEHLDEQEKNTGAPEPQGTDEAAPE